ncbi:hypothetical protein PUP68_21690 [Pseudomonas chlororaphis]|uniref:hypothetical protein n=1 Tax=Pseudomonas chlororaphis TaxID=587753 RepID=UPI002368542B|nr:hypothetical protein [Pseudomonas chlororaphis]WDG77311.1 hypothetical protein PUP77_23170 [Pseudomonas chlororaphis]WDG83450.1 hypothetical protein PUP68_21690 [Pseudomonas chlororaphis]
MPEEIKKAGPDHYRYIDTIGPDGLEVHCITYRVIGETAQCWYIADKYTVDMINGYQHSWTASAVKKRRKRVLKETDAHSKRFAYPDKAHALRSYKLRKSRQLGHAELTLERARAALGYFGDLSVMNEAPVAEKMIIPNEYIQGMGWGDY